MNYVWDQRTRHHNLAAEALRDGRLREAAFHTAKVAECSLQLAGETRGPMGRAYVNDANEMIAVSMRIGAGAAAKPVATAAGGAANENSEWMLEERPNVRLDDVAGLDEVKDALRRNVIWPRLHPKPYGRFRKQLEAGVLMYGPPGTGKTYIARAVAGEFDAAFFSVSGATLKSKWVGRSEKNVKRLFEATAKHERAIIFLDECDDVLSAGQNEKVNIYSQFLRELDGIESRGDALLRRFVLAATNKPWLLGGEVLRPGRLGTHVYVGLPDRAARLAILQRTLKDVPVEQDLQFEALADRLEHRSGADIAWIVERAKDRAIEREVLGNIEDQVRVADLEEIVDSTPPSVSGSSLGKYLQWKHRNDAPPAD